jgi:hypothetical protein
MLPSNNESIHRSNVFLHSRILDMLLRSLSSWKCTTYLFSHVYPCCTRRLYSSSNNSQLNTQFLRPSLNIIESQRRDLFWRANIQRELYGTPDKAAATRKRRRLQKSLAQIIRDGQLWRLFKETILVEWSLWWKEAQPFDRR